MTKEELVNLNNMIELEPSTVYHEVYQVIQTMDCGDIVIALYYNKKFCESMLPFYKEQTNNRVRIQPILMNMLSLKE